MICTKKLPLPVTIALMFAIFCSRLVCRIKSWKKLGHFTAQSSKEPRRGMTGMHRRNHPPPNPPTLFQIAADKLREAEFLRLRRIAQYNFLWTFKGNRSRAKKILFETEDDFRDRICDQVLTRPHTKVLL
jgi:hypothetical protein